MRNFLIIGLLIGLSATSWAQTIQGTVFESVANKSVPLVGANVYWSSTTTGTTTDSVGRFQLAQPEGQSRLVISYVGYKPDTLVISDPSAEIRVTLRAEATLKEVVVSAGGTTQIDRLNPIQTEVLTQRTLAKAACCNLSESFETNASVSVSYSDAVTGARQIQFLGLGGQYVQTNVENIPNIRGLASTFGMSYIPGTWITSIDVGKGVGSVVNGYEGMTGALNIELQKPDFKAETERTQWLLNGYANTFGRVEGNVNVSRALSKKWSVGGLGHVSALRTRIDQNGDNFLDLPMYRQYNAINRWKYNSERFMAQFGFKALYEDREGGQVAAVNGPKYEFTNGTKRLEFFSKMARLYPEKPYRGLGLILNGLNHEQDARFGFAPYSGNQQMLYANLIYQSIIDNTNHTFKTGVSYMLDRYNESYKQKLLPTNRTESVPGAFFEYTYTYPERFALVIGNRIDFHNLYGAQWSPRVHAKYHIHNLITARASAGRGFRVPNLMAENFGYFVSSREVFFRSPLRPEVSWNYGLGLTNEFLMFGNKASFILDYFRTNFTQQMVVDLEHARQINFYQLQGKSFANSFQAELNMQPIRRMEVKAAYRLFDVRQSLGAAFGESVLLERMMVSRDRVLFNVGYALPYDKWKFDATLQWNGPKRIPYMADGYLHPGYANMRTDRAPGFANLNAQVSRTFRNGLELYLGGENLTGFRQLDPIMHADMPFSPNFDAASRVWGPITGAMVYVGFRLKTL
ncbi:TonB-dependent receptor [Rudanella lutea]|uniref:TonB-dependent receptor n=1 Tax=Rudanella lutea TaxID=451374 RepID=UPI00036EB0A4|nr:TonB-dependent receptor [Rudanella lutea]